MSPSAGCRSATRWTGSARGSCSPWPACARAGGHVAPIAFTGGSYVAALVLSGGLALLGASSYLVIVGRIEPLPVKP